MEISTGKARGLNTWSDENLTQPMQSGGYSGAVTRTRPSLGEKGLVAYSFHRFSWWFLQFIDRFLWLLSGRCGIGRGLWPVASTLFLSQGGLLTSVHVRFATCFGSRSAVLELRLSALQGWLIHLTLVAVLIDSGVSPRHKES